MKYRLILGIIFGSVFSLIAIDSSKANPTEITQVEMSRLKRKVEKKEVKTLDPRAKTEQKGAIKKGIEKNQTTEKPPKNLSL